MTTTRRIGTVAFIAAAALVCASRAVAQTAPVDHNTIREEAITHGTVWAIENIGGTWKQPIDLTEEWQKFWCRDMAAGSACDRLLRLDRHDVADDGDAG